MKKGITWFLGLSLIFLWSFTSKVSNDLSDIQDPTIDDIVKSYKKAIVDWPKPNIDKGVKWSEFSSIKRDSLYFVEQDRPDVVLGKMLFFDPKLSKSNQISCSTCHDPEMGWTVRRRVFIGNSNLLGNGKKIDLYKFKGEF